ncbi:hypothetical protein HY095_04165 [Candidatus Micrarchaeota archaeon]|nr:hypothetical protein [Candidatus Micrarchaeota archaeon]
MQQETMAKPEEQAQTQPRPFRNRDAAKCVEIAEIMAGSFVRGSLEGEASFVDSGGERFSRVEACGTVIGKEETQNGPRLFLFDGTGSIAVRAYAPEGARALQGINKGEDCIIVGKLRESQERFLSAESVFPLADPNWETVHCLRTALRKRSHAQGL